MISVIIPVYNIEPYISACAESVIRQTETDLEILLIDDGSRDRSGQICDELACKDARIRVIHTPNRGLSCARNTGLEAAAGEWISFVDGDDLLHPQMLELLLFLAEEKGVSAVLCGIKEFDSDAENVFQKTYSFRDAEAARLHSPGECCKKMLDGKLAYTVCDGIYRKECLENCIFDEGLEYEDVPYNVKLLHSVDGILVTDIPLYGHRQREGSITTTITLNNLEQMIRAYELQMQYIKDFFPDLQMPARAGMWAAVMNHYIEFTSRKQEDRKKYKGIIRDFRKYYRFTVRELTGPGIPLRRAAIGLAGIWFNSAVILKKCSDDRKQKSKVSFSRRVPG